MLLYILVPEQKITGPICASQGPSLPDKERVTQTDIADVRELLTKQRREMDTLRMIVDVDGNMVNEMKLLRKESRNMNSRVTQLYMQLLHEIIRKRDNSLELAQAGGTDPQQHGRGAAAVCPLQGAGGALLHACRAGQ